MYLYRDYFLLPKFSVDSYGAHCTLNVRDDISLRRPREYRAIRFDLPVYRIKSVGDLRARFTRVETIREKNPEGLTFVVRVKRPVYAKQDGSMLFWRISNRIHMESSLAHSPRHP